MNTKISTITRSIALVLSGSVISLSATAATTYYEARNDAMGGTGVASSHYSAAALANPALLTKARANDDFALILPSVGAQVSDPDNLEDGADSVRDAWDRFDDSLNTGDSSAQAAELKRQLSKFKDTHANAQAGVSAVATLPNDTLPAALFVKAWGTATVDGKVSQHDLDYLDQVAAGATADKDNLTSKACGRAAVITDVGIALAREFESFGHTWSVGFTPKYQRVDLFNYNVAVKDYDSSDFDGDQYRNTKNGFNADLGLAADLTENWNVGLVAQNLIPRSIDSKEVNGEKATLKVRPQVTAGTSWTNGFFTGAVDVDLTEASGFTDDKKRQFASIGGEINAWSWAQLRAGYRQNMASSDGSAFTAGIGISPFDVVHLDLTGIAGTDRTYGAVAQLSFTF
ncbi:TPA_asm: conjugal transfer protein TraF [Salmonella enterica subsp. enterica]|uniref:Conjugal transfer protein TraF n=1 Tax=Salmonella enterica I TaxID=59201 RepID=A0A6Y5KZV8_SALET|nr:conjugal transfer protein TraF [Salmonella enterica]HAB1649496.1 conjugal transfer protein TraF [Salmonella enterica subsp. enterica]EHW1978075.1 conjugal transfer protein TraF [Salmonella enterica subsp. enterica serovar Agona]MDQ7445006.1 conjugal transfer protein TraF [Salmonella enterica subsp. enterica serovar Agona]MDQ7465711.1 conjugal transfer protein TraF [Salmonella enterica subsp. enterica serovar Agona]MDQ7484328.1 conjugal transfer protein TraF [Salmonella enterica subsp. enter